MGGIQPVPSWDAQSMEEAEAALTPTVGLGALHPIPPGVPTSRAGSPSVHRCGAEDAGRRSSPAGGRRGLGMGLCRARNQSPASSGEVARAEHPGETARLPGCCRRAPTRRAAAHPVSLCHLGGRVRSSAGRKPSRWCRGLGLHGKGVPRAGVAWGPGRGGGEGRVAGWGSLCCHLWGPDQTQVSPYQAACRDPPVLWGCRRPGLT